MKSKKATSIAIAFQKSAARLDATRVRVEQAHAAGKLRVKDVEATYTGLFLQIVLAYETALEAFVLGLLVRPGGIESAHARVRGRLKVRSYSHALQLASGPKSRYPSWIGKEDVKAIAELLLHKSAPFDATAPTPLNWHYVEQIRFIRNAIAHPSDHAQHQFEKNVIQATPLPRGERSAYSGEAGPAFRFMPGHHSGSCRAGE
jgi:hypothetical protein